MIKHCLLVAILVCAVAAHADIKGTYRFQDGQQMELFYRNPEQIRMTIGSDAQLVVKNGKSWMLTRQAGQWLALDAAQMGSVMQAMGQQASSPSPAGDSGEITVRSLDRKEMVAGYEGEVWEISDGRDRYEVVLSEHPDVRALTEGWRQMADKLTQNLSVADTRHLQEALQALPGEKTGLLRQGNNLVLLGVDKQVSPADVDFPPGTQKMEMPSIPGLGKLPGMR